MDRYLLEVGLPGARVGKSAGAFDWQAFTSCRFATSSISDNAKISKLDHVGWLKFQMTDRLKSRSQADAEWWEAVADVQRFPGRGYTGPGECPQTLGCMRQECANGNQA